MLTPAHVILELNKVKEELDQLKAELEHEKRDRKIIVSCLESELSTLRGPKCPDENCLDYDGEHPYHNNVRVQAWEKAQKELVRPLQEQLAILTAQLAEQEAALVLADEVCKKTAAFVSWLAHSRAVMAPSTLGLLDRINAAEKEYGAARAGLDEPIPPTKGKEPCGKSVTGWLRCVLPKGHDGQCSDVKKK